jgi:hypothetical protein
MSMVTLATTVAEYADCYSPQVPRLLQSTGILAATIYTRELRLLHFMETPAAKTNASPGCYNTREPMLLLTMGTLSATAPGNHGRYSHGNLGCCSPREPLPLKPW